MNRWALLLAAIPACAAAQERPLTQPTRDVDVTYRATVGGKPVEQRTRTLAGAASVRIDTPSPGLYMILDRSSQTMDMVSDPERGVVQMPYDPNKTSQTGNAAAFRRLGADVVAGLPCTEWATTDTAGREIAACFTPDGVFLRARAGANILVQAVSVTFGRIDPAVFAIPSGYRRAAAPARP